MGDFGLTQRAAAEESYFSRGWETAYEYSEYDCRGESVRVVGCYPQGWAAYVLLEDGPNGRQIPLHDEPLPSRPEYTWVERRINERYPDPRFKRRVDEAVERGPKVLRDIKGDGWP